MSNPQTLRQWLLLRLLASEGHTATIKRAGFPIVERTGEYGSKTFALEPAALPPLTFTCDDVLALFLYRNVTKFRQSGIPQIRASFRTITTAMHRNGKTSN